ncbi:hypothetical protein A2630_01330 [Candidatus Woesebacteria bacterium RIFCSPHIGHO2_01_FULL_44_10]|uniref:BioF2-like acetyltransferase domain-containing protein n=1 Tax=Candidatus Woesebacteria bacterium RIFCSPLOWO2_01_FULL_44_14 TaxID=1802525 RepID=A0A1F8C2N5_9BACT|nr:MAG: hypothetical protein A2630_01330 [Candidatus Woesebacteria bacterium RIFCSPHIGHO2_01_FULL_44_10]OGM55683.1 MAG: hypothetical protein A3F62_02570 [Candidatus Woesebacteria bacterium RIFCSPHIGHO2_12_FULL_44_11]OGM70109.1 MAG: hypothetical protein A2975_03470 [Candidatus Woesebacteria bacterium RIFCSPLOWO2_01_FULL_44_14]
MDLGKVATHPLQTTAWADFRREWGNEVFDTKYGIIVVNRLLPTGLGLGTFIRGPKPTKQMLEELAKLGKKEKLIFIKLEPNVLKNNADVNLLHKAGAVPGKTLFTPTSFWIDLTKSEDELMKSFTSKTRYNVRYARRKGVEVVEDNSDAAFEKYLGLTRETVARQGFYAHSERYHHLMWKHLRKAGIAHLLVTRHNKETLTAWIIFHHGDFIYYPYGAWSGSHQNLQPNSLMMWEAIKLGKKLGAKTFDLWGREEGKGFTKFKEGYSPQVVEFLGTWDLVINKPLYYLYRMGESLRWPILHLKAKFIKPTF